MKRHDHPNGKTRVRILLAVCAVVFGLFLARLAWMQFVMADHYAQKVAEASSASYRYTVPAARGDILDRDGTVLFCHYGASLTDVPEDCASIQSLLEELDLTPDVPELAREALRQAFAETAPRARRAAVLDRDPSGEFLPPEVIREYGAPDLAETSVIDLFDDPYEDD